MRTHQFLAAAISLGLSGCATLQSVGSRSAENHISGIDVGGTDTCVVYEDGSAACWGHVRQDSIFPMPVHAAEHVRVVEAGGFRTCAVSVSGKLMCSIDILGIAWNDPRVAHCRMYNCLHSSPHATTQRFTTVTTGFLHACVLDVSGRAFCFGANHMGQLGNGNRTPTNNGDAGEPVLAPSAVFGDMRFKSITTQGMHVCALNLQGEAYCWGYGQNGEIGSDTVATYCTGARPYFTASCSTDRPVRVLTSQRFRHISAGTNLTCAVSLDENAYCWGSNYRCELGTCGPDHIASPRRIAVPAKVAHVSAGYNFACAVALDRRAFCWGNNNSGQLGTEVIDSTRQCFNGGSCTPIPVEVSGNRRWLSVSTAENRACGITTQHEVFCWGSHRHRDTPIDTVRARCIEEDNLWQGGRCIGLSRIPLPLERQKKPAPDM